MTPSAGSETVVMQMLFSAASDRGCMYEMLQLLNGLSLS